MAKNKSHAYLYNEWEELKGILKRQNARLHAAKTAKPNEYPGYDTDVFYQRRDFDIRECKNAIRLIEKKIKEVKKLIKYSNAIYQKCL